MAANEDRQATIARVSQVGCAAVHLAVTGCEYTVTGFRWGEKLIVSCGHFHRWRFEENQQGKLETLLADPSPCMFSQERLLVAQTGLLHTTSSRATTDP